MIYLITCHKTNSCKIGYSSNPSARLSQLQTGNPFPLELTAVISGDLSLERELHAEFKNCKMQGEWFEYNDFIKAFFEVDERYLMYSSMLSILKSSSDVRLKLFASLVERYAGAIGFSMSKDLKEFIAIECGCSARSFDNSFTSLVRQGLVIKLPHSFYKINPTYISKP